ncbi:MAG: hypothetical protein EAZ55_03815 [Cytophagales bacterium]|nr:MAG: hypothetical protein EAZ55_03815 [Cytophagales bacterium]
MTNELLTYLYGIIAQLPTQTPKGVEFVPIGQYFALTTQVESQDFTDPQWSENIQNMAWLEHKIRQHEEIIQFFITQQDILPSKFPTLFASKESLQTQFVERQLWLKNNFERLQDKQEWDIKVWLQPTSQPTKDAPPKSQTGKSYFLEKIKEKEKKQNQTAQINQFCQDLWNKLCLISTEMTQAKTQESTMLFRIIMLLRKEQSLLLANTITEMNEAAQANGVFLTLTGPWAAYHFMTDTP